MQSRANVTTGMWTLRLCATPPASRSTLLPLGMAASRLTIAVLLLGATVPLLGITARLAAQSPGEQVFQTTCVACHTLGTDRLVGPGLAGVVDNRDREWLLDFITEPDRVIDSGDPIATELAAEYAVPMPNIGTTRAQAEAVLDFLTRQGEGADVGTASSVTAALGSEATSLSASEDDIRFGRALFEGPVRFSNGGPTCNACHNVVHDDVWGGGALAADLTDVFSRIGEPGVRAIIANPPFPLMQAAYADRPLSEDEVNGLVAFLGRADGERSQQEARGYGGPMLGAGVTGTALLLVLFSLMWRGRRKGSVHQALFDRQVESI